MNHSGDNFYGLFKRPQKKILLLKIRLKSDSANLDTVTIDLNITINIIYKYR